MTAHPLGAPELKITRSNDSPLAIGPPLPVGSEGQSQDVQLCNDNVASGGEARTRPGEPVTKICSVRENAVIVPLNKCSMSQHRPIAEHRGCLGLGNGDQWQLDEQFRSASDDSDCDPQALFAVAEQSQGCDASCTTSRSTTPLGNTNGTAAIPGTSSMAKHGGLSSSFSSLITKAKPQELESNTSVVVRSHLADSKESCHLVDATKDDPNESSVDRGVELLLRFREFGDISDLQLAVSALEDCMRSVLPGDQRYPELLNHVGNALYDRFQRLGELTDLDGAIARLENCLQFTPNGHPEVVDRLDDLSNAFRTRFELAGELQDLERAIAIQQEILQTLPDAHTDRVICLYHLAVYFRDRFDRLGKLEDLNRAIESQEDVVRLTPDDHPYRATRLNNLACSLTIRLDHLGDLSDLDQAIARQEDALRLTPADHPEYVISLNNLGSLFRLRFQRLGNLGDLDQAISMQEQALRLTPHDQPAHAIHLNNLVASLVNRFERFGDLGDLDRAISMQEDVIRTVPNDHPDRAAYLNNLGISLGDRFERLGNPRAIDQAITSQQDAVQLTSHRNPNRSLYLSSLGSSFRSRFERLGDLGDLEQAIARQRDAVQLAPDGHAKRALYLNKLASTLSTRFQRLGDLDDLTQAIARQEEAVRLTAGGHTVYRAAYLDDLGLCLRSRFERLGELGDLDLAIARQEEAVGLSPQDYPGRALSLNNLAASFMSRFDRLGNLGDLNQAIARQEAAVQLLPDDHPERARYLNNLGLSFHTRFDRLGALVDLDQAIGVQAEAVSLTPNDHPQRVVYLNNLGLSFHTRFDLLGVLEDLNQAIAVQDQTVSLAANDHPHLAVYLSNLGSSLRIRFEHSGDIGDIDGAITRQEDAVRLTSQDHPNHATYLNNLAVCFRSRFERTSDLGDLDQAITRQEDSVRLIPSDHPERARYLNNLGVYYRDRFNHLGELGELEKAISRQEEALQLIPHDHPQRARHLNTLGISLKTAFIRLGDHSTLERALFNFSCAACSSHSTSLVRFSASQGWTSCARLSENNTALLDAYSSALHLLPQLAWIGLQIRDRYNELLRAANVAPEAASAALELGSPVTAVEWLEQGRSIVWTELFQLRTALDELRVEHPTLANRLREVSNALELAAGSRDQPSHSEGTNVPPLSLEEQGRRHRSLALERDKLLTHIRSLPGFERFLMGKSITQLSLSAHSGPVIILNISERRCDALIIATVDSDNVQHVPLPDVTLKQAEELRAMLAHALQEIGRDLSKHAPHDPISDTAFSHPVDQLGEVSLDLIREDISRELSSVERAAKRVRRLTPSECFQSVLSTLWTHVVKPVLDAMNFSTSGELRRIFWCPTGPFAFLPIHAAGLYDTTEPGTKLSDFAISSYTPTLSALIQMPELNEGQNIRLLAVRQPNSDGQCPLPGTGMEIKYIEATLRNLSSPHVTLIQSEATVEDVLEKMKNSDWVHFACHGVQDRESPIDSGLLLADRRRLTLSDIIKLSRPRGGLAFLSACHTATGDTQLSEEAVHLAAGMLLAGYSSVVATMWSIGDYEAPEVAKNVYEHIFRDDQVPDSRRSAAALHHAVQRLREQGTPFYSWVPFIHVGL